MPKSAKWVAGRPQMGMKQVVPGLPSQLFPCAGRMGAGRIIVSDRVLVGVSFGQQRMGAGAYG